MNEHESTSNDSAKSMKSILIKPKKAPNFSCSGGQSGMNYALPPFEPPQAIKIDVLPLYQMENGKWSISSLTAITSQIRNESYTEMLFEKQERTSKEDFVIWGN